jgi:hypothetical protein
MPRFKAGTPAEAYATYGLFPRAPKIQWFCKLYVGAEA